MSDKLNAIADVLGAILSSFKEDDTNAFEKIADYPAIVQARKFIEQGNAEDFHLFTLYPIESMMGTLIVSTLASKGVDKEAVGYIKFIFLHASEIEHHYQNLIRKAEGFACCADKSRTIISRLVRFFTNGEKIEFDFRGEYTYHLPTKVFTTHDEIVEFFHGLHEFHYGSSERYIKALAGVLARISPKAVV